MAVCPADADFEPHTTEDPPSIGTADQVYDDVHDDLGADGGPFVPSSVDQPGFLAAPLTRGQAPTIGTATITGLTEVTVTFTPSTEISGDPVDLFVVTSSTGGFTGSGTSSPVVVSGLAPGKSYTFTVKARNENGDSAPSSASNSVTLEPSAPTIGVATVSGVGEVDVAFTAPTGGQTITGYTATSDPDGVTGTGTTSPITVSGLDNGQSYTFTVHATNTTGDSAESAASAAVVTPPSAPTIGTATPGDGQASVAFTAPPGETVDTYTVTSTPGDFTATGPSSPLVVTGLTNDTAYTFTVHATNSGGDSPESASSAPATPTAP